MSGEYITSAEESSPDDGTDLVIEGLELTPGVVVTRDSLEHTVIISDEENPLPN